jgi:hypothetical protein
MTWETSSAIIILLFAAIVIIGIFSILKWSKDKTRKVSNLRLFIQIVAVFAVFMGLLIGPFGQSQWLPLGIAPRDQ